MSVGQRLRTPWFPTSFAHVTSHQMSLLNSKGLDFLIFKKSFNFAFIVFFKSGKWMKIIFSLIYVFKIFRNFCFFTETKSCNINKSCIWCQIKILLKFYCIYKILKILYLKSSEISSRF